MVIMMKMVMIMMNMIIIMNMIEMMMMMMMEIMMEMMMMHCRISVTRPMMRVGSISLQYSPQPPAEMYLVGLLL